MSGDDEKKKKVSDWNEAGYYGSVFASDRVQVGNKTPKFDYNHIEKPTTSELKKLRYFYIKAAKLVYQAAYNDRKGGIRGDLKPLDQMSDNELVAFAKSEMGWFSQNTVGLTKWFARLKSGNMTQDQKQAFGYLMEIHDHTATSWGDVGNFLYKGLLADPTTYVGLGTLGAGTVAAQGAKQLAKKGVTQIIKASLKKQVVKELGGLTLRQATKRQIIGAAMKASAKQTLTGTMIRGTRIGIQRYGLQRGLGQGLGIGLKSSLRNGSLAVAAEGAITSWYMDDRLQKSKVFAGVQDEYSTSQNRWSVAMGVGMGEIFTFGAGFLGRGTTGLYGKYFDDPPSTLIKGFAKQLRDGVGTGLQRLDNAYQGSSLQRWSRSQMGVLSMNPFGAAGGTRPRRRGGSTSTTKKKGSIIPGGASGKLVTSVNYWHFAKFPIHVVQCMFKVPDKKVTQPYAEVVLKLLDGQYENIVKLAKAYEYLKDFGFTRKRMLNRMQLSKVLEFDLDAHKYIDPYVESSSKVVLKHFKDGKVHPEAANIAALKKDVLEELDEITLRGTVNAGDISSISSKKTEIARIRAAFEAEKIAMEPDLKALRDELKALQDEITYKAGDKIPEGLKVGDYKKGTGYKQNRLTAIENDINRIELQNTHITEALDEFDAVIDKTVKQLNTSRAATSAPAPATAGAPSTSASTFNFAKVQDDFNKGVSSATGKIEGVFSKRQELFDDSYVAIEGKYPPNYKSAKREDGTIPYTAGEPAAGEIIATRRRQIMDSYINPHARRIKVVLSNNKSGSNAEKIFGNILDLADEVLAGKIKVGDVNYKERLTSAVSSLIKEGSDHEAMAALELMMWKAGGEGAPNFIYDGLKDDITKSLKNFYDEIDLDPNKDPWLSSIKNKIDSIQNPKHGFEKGQERPTLKWIMDNYQNVIMGLRFPADPSKALAPPGEFPFITAPILKFQNRLKAFFGGGRIKKLSSEDIEKLGVDGKGDYRKLTGETVEWNPWIWWAPGEKAAEKAGFGERWKVRFNNLWTLGSRAPRPIKVLANLAITPVYIPYRVGKGVLKVGWDLTKTPIMFTGIGGGLLFGLGTLGTSAWEDEPDSFKYKAANTTKEVGKAGIKVAAEIADVSVGLPVRTTLSVASVTAKAIPGENKLAVIDDANEYLHIDNAADSILYGKDFIEKNDDAETIDGPEDDRTGAVVPPDASTSTADAGTTTTKQPEKKKAPPPIHGNQDAGDYFKIKTKGRSSKKSSGSDWDFFNNYAAGSSGGNGGGSGPKGALERTGTGLMNFGGFLKDNILDPVVGGVKGLYKNNPDGFGFLMAIVTAFVSGNFIFKGSGILGTVLTGVFAYFAFNMAKGSAGGFGQGNGDHVPRMTSADQNYRRIGNVRLPSDINTVRMTSHSGSTSSLYINHNVEGLTVTDDEETGSGGDSRGLSKTLTAATFTSVANDVQPIDPQQAALLSAMTGEGEGGALVSGFTAVQGGGRYGDINAARDFSGAANFTAYDNQGDDGFVPQEMRSDDPFAYMDVADSHEVNAKVVTFNLAQEEFSGPPSLPHGPVAGQNVRMGMNT